MQNTRKTGTASLAVAGAIILAISTTSTFAQGVRAPLETDPDAVRLAMAAFDVNLFKTGALEELASVTVQPPRNRIQHGAWPTGTYEPQQRHHVSESVPIPPERLAVRSVYLQFLPDEAPIDFTARIP